MKSALASQGQDPGRGHDAAGSLGRHLPLVEERVRDVDVAAPLGVTCRW